MKDFMIDLTVQNMAIHYTEMSEPSKSITIVIIWICNKNKLREILVFLAILQSSGKIKLWKSIKKWTEQKNLFLDMEFYLNLSLLNFSVTYITAVADLSPVYSRLYGQNNAAGRSSYINVNINW